MKYAVLILVSFALGLTPTAPNAKAHQPLTRIQRSCLIWDLTLQRMLTWSEEYAIHTPEMQSTVRAETTRLRERCSRDVTTSTIDRYVILSKLLYDDEADEIESFD